MTGVVTKAAKSPLPAITAALLAVGLVTEVAAGEDSARLLFGMEAAYAKVSDYTALFARQEVIEGRLRPAEEALLKYRRPRSIYLRWVAGPGTGREILFVEGRDGGRILLHHPGLLSGLVTAVLAPDSPRVLRESRHPITDVGIGRLIELIAANARRALGRNELAVADAGVVEARGRREHRLELTLPRDPAKGYYCYRAIVAIDLEWNLPVAARIFDWSDRMVEDYRYREVQLNPGLSPLDFDPANPEYRFPRWRVNL